MVLDIIFSVMTLWLAAVTFLAAMAIRLIRRPARGAEHVVYQGLSGVPCRCIIGRDHLQKVSD